MPGGFGTNKSAITDMQSILQWQSIGRRCLILLVLLDQSVCITASRQEAAVISRMVLLSHQRAVVWLRNMRHLMSVISR